MKTLEAVTQRCSVKKVFLEISQNPQENACARVSFLIKLQAQPATLLKKRLWHRCFPVNFEKFLRTPLLTEHLWWLLLKHLHRSLLFSKVAGFWYAKFLRTPILQNISGNITAVHVCNIQQHIDYILIYTEQQVKFILFLFICMIQLG